MHRPWSTAAAGRTLATLTLAASLACASDPAAPPPATEDAADASGLVRLGDETSSAVAAPKRWLSGYYPGFQRSLYPESQVDFTIMTHIFVGAVEATPTGGVTTDFFLDKVSGPAMAKTLSSRAHLAKRKAILMLGGAGFRANLVSASSNRYRATFVANLLRTMDALGYDGIDVDWEPITASDKPLVLQLLRDLRAARPAMLLTIPVMWVNSNFGADPWYAQVAPLVDQVNLMTYGMADNWGGWVSWHQAALAGEGGNHPSSVSSNVRAFLAAGVPAAKLGIGLGFYGSCWRGTSAPLQTLGATARVYASDNTMTYANIMSQYYNAKAYRWDATAKAGYLTFAVPTGPQQCTMVSYEDPTSIAKKGAYVKSNGLGGAIIWTINQGHIATKPVGQQDPLLLAAYNAIVK